MAVATQLVFAVHLVSSPPAVTTVLLLQAIGVAPAAPEPAAPAPAAPVESPAAPVEPAAPVVLPAAPVVLPAAPVVLPAAPLESPAAPVALPAAPVVLPAWPLESPAAPVVLPAAPVVLPAAPVEPALPVVVGTMRRGLLVQATKPAMTKQDIAISVLFMETISSSFDKNVLGQSRRLRTLTHPKAATKP
jgi:hypothetical protein